jgi:uncharacterized membrane protein HdeD (DUF308 family)
MILGILALNLTRPGTVASVMLLAWLVVVSGLVEAIHAFHLRGSGGFFFHLIPAIAGVPLGLLIATHPDAGLVAWELVFASFFTVVGLFRWIAAVRLKFPNWSWAAFDGIATLVLSTLFWTTWTWLGWWFFGVAVGVSLILRGWSSIMLALGSSLPSHTSSWVPRAQHNSPSGRSPRVEAADLS